MRTNIGPRKKRSPKKPAVKTTNATKTVAKRKLFGGVKGGRRKVDPNIARNAQILKELRKYDWLDEDVDEEDVGTTEIVDDDEQEIVSCVDTKECCDAELAEIARDLENGFDSVDSDTISVIRKTNDFLDETREAADFSNKGKKPRVSRIPAEVAKNLAAFKFFNEDESRKKDDEFDTSAIINMFKMRHPWFVDTDKAFKQSAKRFFANHKYVLALMLRFDVTIEEFMKLFVAKYVELITPDLIRNDIIPCVAKCRTTQMSKSEADRILSTAD